MVLEDLGEGGDFTDLYRGAKVGEEDLLNYKQKYITKA
jgi:hypothetical protein